MENSRPIRRALLSVSDKTGIVEFAQSLHATGVTLLSTGGTAKLLKAHQIPVTNVSDVTDFPEMMDGRVKTLHPKIHGGILGRRGTDDNIMAQHQIPAIDLVVVNLYPFANTIANPDCTLENAIENIDIGGPTMVRSAAKNHKDVAIVVKNDDFCKVLAEMESSNNSLSLSTRFELAVSAFEHTAHYDGMIANFLGKKVSLESDKTDQSNQIFPRTFNQQWTKKQDLRYGENSHQDAAFYIDNEREQGCIGSAIQIQGKALSYNNIADTDAALECVKQFEQPACVIVKHANPCGVAVEKDLYRAYEKAYQTDPTSAFGGIIAFNRALDAETAQSIISRQFVEVIIAPSISDDAKSILVTKPNVRVLMCGQFSQTSSNGYDLKRVTGGLLVQGRDEAMVSNAQLRVVTKKQPSKQELDDALFCWKVAKFVKSNAIVYAKDKMTIGIGAGQMSRVYSAKIASIKAHDEKLVVEGSVMASDAFFPFRDGIDAAAKAGITCVIQPGGSMRDEEVIEAANEHGMSMIFTDMRHFRH